MSEALNEIHAYFGKLNTTTTKKVSQWAYGQKLIIHDPELPPVFEAYYSNSRSRGTADPQIGTDGVVDAPHAYFRSGADIYVFLMVHEGQDDGRYNKIVHIPIDPCAEPSDVEPEPYEQNVIDQAIAVLNDAVEQTGEDKAATAALAEAAAASSLVATEAAQSAQGSATSASASASTATNAAFTATTKASEAATSAANAQAAEHAIKDMTVSSQTLEAGSEATVTKTEGATKFNLDFGIPQGEKGDPALQILANKPCVLIPTDENGAVSESYTFNLYVRCFKGAEEVGTKNRSMDRFPLSNGTYIIPQIIISLEGNYVYYQFVLPVGCIPKYQNSILWLRFTVDGIEYNQAFPYACVRKGEQGETGATPDLTIGTVQTLPAGSQATASITGTDEEPVLNLGLPKGDTGDVSDVQINGASIVDTQGVANVPIAGANVLGLVKKVNPANDGINLATDGTLQIYRAPDAYVKTGTALSTPIVPGTQHLSAFYGLAKAAGSDEKNSTLALGTYTENAKSAISTMLNAPVEVTGTTPTITAKSGIQYICGEVATLDITLPDSGIVDVVFTSGATATVLTVTPPTGQTVRWANGFDATALEANTVYEINILNGLGVAQTWSTS